MSKITDEILKKYASILDDLPVPLPPTPEELKTTGPEKAIEETSKVLAPIEIEDKPLSVRDVEKPEEVKQKRKKLEVPFGSTEWEADKHTREFLRGVYTPWDRFYVDDPAEREELVGQTMKKLIRYWPEEYFNWQLYKKNELRPWLIPSAEALIKKDPLDALIKEIWKYGEIGPMLKSLWRSVFEKEFARSSQSEKNEFMPHLLRKKMRSLAGVIAETDPDFYMEAIAHLPKGSSGFTTEEFNEKAQRVYDLHKNRGLINEPDIQIDPEGKWLR